jgi:hypothetical protein
VPFQVTSSTSKCTIPSQARQTRTNRASRTSPTR